MTEWHQVYQHRPGVALPGYCTRPLFTQDRLPGDITAVVLPQLRHNYSGAIPSQERWVNITVAGANRMHRSIQKVDCTMSTPGMIVINCQSRMIY